MRKNLLLKKVVENPELKDKYWPKFNTDPEISDYGPLILREKNKYLSVLKEIITEENTTSRNLHKKIFNLFEV